MRKLPRKIKQWAAESYEALDNAWLLWSEDYPLLAEAEPLTLMTYAVPIAAVNRGVDKKHLLHAASEKVLDNFYHDIETSGDHSIDYSMSFLIAYLDAQQLWGFLSQVKNDDVTKPIHPHQCSRPSIPAQNAL